MKWSWKIGQLAGIDVRIHATFVLLPGWIGASYWVTSGTVDAMLGSIGFIGALFGCIVLHELGHAVAARECGIRTRDITLLPIGGVARLARIPEEPKEELRIALAGPAVTVIIAAALYCWLAITHVWEPLGVLRVATGSFVERLFVANLMLLLFNLIPAFPMDGGRVLRALLASRMTYSKATRIAASIGQGLAVPFGLIGLFSNPMLLFIGLLVWIGAAQEAGAVEARSALAGIPAKAAMLTEFQTLRSDDTLADAVHLTLKTPQRDFPVIAQGQLVGILSRTDMLAAWEQYGDDHPVFRAMTRDFPIAESAEMLEAVFQRLRECECNSMPVAENGRLVGLITMEHLGEYLSVERALQKRGVHGPVPAGIPANPRRL